MHFVKYNSQIHSGPQQTFSLNSNPVFIFVLTNLVIICSRSRDAILNFRFFSDFNSLIFPVFVTPVSTIRHPFSIVFRKNIIFNSRTESFSSISNQSEYVDETLTDFSITMEDLLLIDGFSMTFYRR